MYYAATRRYHIMPQFMEEVMWRIRNEFLFVINQEPGFLAYYALRAGSNEILTISIFDSQTGAEGSTPVAFAWVQLNIASYVEKVGETTVGPLFAFSFGTSPAETREIKLP